MPTIFRTNWPTPSQTQASRRKNQVADCAVIGKRECVLTGMGNLSLSTRGTRMKWARLTIRTGKPRRKTSAPRCAPKKKRSRRQNRQPMILKKNQTRLAIKPEQPSQRKTRNEHLTKTPLLPTAAAEEQRFCKPIVTYMFFLVVTSMLQHRIP